MIASITLARNRRELAGQVESLRHAHDGKGQFLFLPGSAGQEVWHNPIPPRSRHPDGTDVDLANGQMRAYDLLDEALIHGLRRGDTPTGVHVDEDVEGNQRLTAMSADPSSLVGRSALVLVVGREGFYKESPGDVRSTLYLSKQGLRRDQIRHYGGALLGINDLSKGLTVNKVEDPSRAFHEDRAMYPDIVDPARTAPILDPPYLS